MKSVIVAGPVVAVAAAVIAAVSDCGIYQCRLLFATSGGGVARALVGVLGVQVRSKQQQSGAAREGATLTLRSYLL